MAIPMPPYDALVARGNWWVRNAAPVGGSANIDTYISDWWEFPRAPSGTWVGLEMCLPEDIASFYVHFEGYLGPSMTYFEASLFQGQGTGHRDNEWCLFNGYDNPEFFASLAGEAFYLIAGFDGSVPYAAVVQGGVVAVEATGATVSTWPGEAAYGYHWNRLDGEGSGAGLGICTGAFFDESGLIWEPTETTQVTDFWADYGEDPHTFDVHEACCGVVPERPLPQKLHHIWVCNGARGILRNAR